MVSLSKKILYMGLAFLLLVMSVACGNKNESVSTETANKNGKSETKKEVPIIVGGMNITEQFILGELYYQALKSAGFPTDKKLNLGGGLIVFEALKNGEIGLNPGYTGTYWMNILKQDAIYDKEEIYNSAKKMLKEKYDIDILDQAPVNNTFVLVTRKEIAEKYQLKTLSDLASKAPELTLGLIPEFETRKDGLPGLQQVYGGYKFKDMKLFDAGLKYKSLAEKQVDVTVGYGTDGQISGFGLTVLTDDKQFWPPYYVAPSIRKDVLDANPGAEKVINQVSALLTNEVVAELNWKVDGDKEEPEKVAEEFLKKHGLVK